MQEGQYKQAPARPAQAPPESARTQDPPLAAGGQTIVEKFNLPPKILEPKPAAVILGGILIFGIVVGWALFGGGTQQVVINGLGGVVGNPEITENLNRCGTVDRNYDCVYYFVNPSRRELEAREFFGQVADLTSVQKFMVETSNLRYANHLIKPGYIGQFRIPAYR